MEDLEPVEPVILYRIVIEQKLVGDGDLVDVVLSEVVTGGAGVDEGDPVPLGTALGMLRLAEDTLIREAMGED